MASSSTTIRRAPTHTGRDALRRYAQVDLPSTGIPHRVYLASSETCTAIYDLYPKSRYHFVLLPRAQFAVSDTTSGLQGAKVHIPLANLDHLRALAGDKHVLQVLLQLSALAKEVKELIREDMMALYGRTWPIQAGFHAHESMPHVHCHVISQDFLGEWMKKPKHWNTFHPHHGFFLHLDQCIQWAQSRQLANKLPSKEAAAKLVKGDLYCHRDECQQRLPNMEALRAHLQNHFDRDAANPPATTQDGNIERREETTNDDVGRKEVRDIDDETTDYDSDKTEDE